MSRKLTLNSLSGTFLYFANIVVAFIMSPVLIRALGNRDYGLWELVLSLMGYMGLLDLGIGAALVRFVSVEDGKQDGDGLQETISTSFFFFIAVGLVAALILSLLSLKPEIVGGGEIGDVANLQIVFLLLAFNALMLFPLQVFTATLMGVQRHYLINNVRVVLVIVQACSTYLLLQKFDSHGLIILAFVTPVFSALQLFFLSYAVVSSPQLPKISFAAVSFVKVREMAVFAVKSALMLIASRLQSQSVPIIISHVVGLSSVVYFVLPNQLMRYARGLSLAIAFPLAPYFGAAVGRGDHLQLVKSWLMSTQALQIVSLAMPIFLFFFGEPFLELWLGLEYARAGHYVLYILIVGLVADSLAINAYNILTAHNAHGRCAFGWLILSAISIPCGIAGAYLWGVEGVTAAAVMVTVFGNLMTLGIACRLMSVSPVVYIRCTIGKLLIPLTILIVLLYLLHITQPISSYLIMVLHIILGGFSYLISVVLLVVDTQNRKKIWAKVGGILARQGK